jgi:hypothetical protein
MRTCLLCESTSEGTGVTFHRMTICDWCDNELTRSGRAWCTTKQHIVPLSDIGADRSRCKPCGRAYQKGRNLDRRAYAKAYCAANLDKIRAYRARPEVRSRRAMLRRKRYWSNPEQARAKDRQRYHRTAEHRRQAGRRSYWKNPARWRRYQAQRRVARKLAILREWRRG